MRRTEKFKNLVEKRNAKVKQEERIDSLVCAGLKFYDSWAKLRHARSNFHVVWRPRGRWEGGRCERKKAINMCSGKQRGRMEHLLFLMGSNSWKHLLQAKPRP